MALLQERKFLIVLLQERKKSDSPSPVIFFHRGSQKNFLFEFSSGSSKIINGQPITAINNLNNQSLLILTS